VSSTPEQISAVADRLQQAQQTLVPTPPVRDVLGATDVVAAYAVQRELADRRVAQGARVVGRKIGLTSAAVQQQLGVDQPDFGVLFDDMGFSDGAVVPTDDLLQPKVEAEIAFVLADDLDGPLDLATVRGAIDYGVAALEIVDSRVRDWDITIVDTVADNGSSAKFVLGTQRLTLDEVEPKDVEMTMSVNDEVLSRGNGAACLGDPLEAVLWLARTAQENGDPLRAGQVVLSGALGPMVVVDADDTVRAELSHFGSVTTTFVIEENA
jgi:2-keto-4-pentenoate hydratase